MTELPTFDALIDQANYEMDEMTDNLLLNAKTFPEQGGVWIHVIDPNGDEPFDTFCTEATADELVKLFPQWVQRFDR